MSERTAEAAVDRGYAWAVAVVSLLLMSFAVGGMYGVVVGLKTIAAEFAVPRWVPSAGFSLVMLGMGIGGIAMGRWSDRVGMLKPALVGSFGIGLGALAAGFSQGPVSLLLAHALLLGLMGNGAMFSPLVANVTHWFQRYRGVAVAIVISGQSVGGVVWPPLFRYVMENFGWRQSYLLFGLLALAAMLPMCLVFRRPPPLAEVAAEGSAGGHEGRALGLAPNLVLGLLGLAIIGCCVAMAMPMVHVVAHASDLGHPTARAAEVLALLLACGTVSRLGFGALCDHIGSLRTLFISACLQAIMLTLFTMVDSLGALYLVAALFGLSFGGIVPTYTLVVRDLYPAGETAWRLGVIYLFGTIGMALGGWLGGLIFDLTESYQIAFIVGVAFNILNLLIVGSLLVRFNRQTLAPQLA
ncbi:MAG: MFS transporter [Alphaproteobacteria bacterium]|jgi:MFS family permease|nr:MFS transporter [Alphaproteobacteria bacterium]MDP6621114.1 MFS transporter [Alphaproteobacteria bacterium]|tara:strand:+ start:400 stop:1635 length:1236 start_codon:yes stop_codon:yes gene_type:complete